MFLKASKERGPCPQTSTPDKMPLGLILGVVKSRALTTDLGLHPVFPAQSSGARASWSECFSSLTGVTVSTLGRTGVQTLRCDVIQCTPRSHQEGSLPHFLQTMLQWELTERLSLINLKMDVSLLTQVTMQTVKPSVRFSPGQTTFKEE